LKFKKSKNVLIFRASRLPVKNALRLCTLAVNTVKNKIGGFLCLN